jgi:hypothetical protein
MAWVSKWLDYKARLQDSVEGVGVICLQNSLKNSEPRHQVCLGHVPKVFRELIRGFGNSQKLLSSPQKIWDMTQAHLVTRFHIFKPAL